MIWRAEFDKINFVVEQAVKEIYQKLENTNDYIVFLSFGEYMESAVKSKYSPYVIDSRIDGFKDDAWRQTLMTFINSSYNFHSENTADSKVSIFFEKMMYLHIWESRPYLRHLKRMATLIDGKDYEWKLTISDKKKSVFLLNQVLPIFGKHKLKVVDIIKKGFEKQIRDAIAHNEYWHNWSRPEIIFENYKPNPNRIAALHYNEWTKRFCYTFLLAYHLRNYFEIKKQELDDEQCQKGFKVKVKDKRGRKVDGIIFYNKEHNSFKFGQIK